MLKVDLHLHASEDKREPVMFYDAKMLIDRAKELEFDALAITLHDQFFYNEDIKKYADSRDIILIPGIEKEIEDKHVLILNIDKYPDIDKLEDLAKLPKSSLIIAPHPFYFIGRSVGKFLKENPSLFHGVEYNSVYLSFLNSANRKAKKFSVAHNLPLVGNTDCHLLSQFGRTYTLVDAKKDKESIIRAIKNNKVILMTRPLGFFVFVKFILRSILSKFAELFGINMKKVHKTKIKKINDRTEQRKNIKPKTAEKADDSWDEDLKDPL
ncbi:MAG: PHP-associated domain-containing protein [Candidatus Woesearchaeota archaeon]